MRKSVFVVSCLLLTLAVAPACATKKFVRTEVGQVNDKVATMGKSLEETQERVRQTKAGSPRSTRKAAAAGAGGADRRSRPRRPAQQTGTQAMEVGQHRRRRAPRRSKPPAASSSSKSC